MKQRRPFWPLGSWHQGVLPLLLAGLILPVNAVLAAADRFSDVQVQGVRVSGGIYMLTGAGGNIAASIGSDGVLIVDDQFLPLAEQIQAELDRLAKAHLQATGNPSINLGGAQPKFVLNTHHHGDHTGGNAHFGQQATIIAHHNVRRRLLGNEALPAMALPVVTFANRLSMHFNGDQIRLLHLPEGHTDGDSAVWFINANVLHLGDQLFSGRFPYIDLNAGGSVDGYIANLESILEQVPADVKVIPGHGPLVGLAAVEAMAKVIRVSRQVVASALAEGSSVKDIVEAGLGPEYASWGEGFIDEKRWIQILAADIVAAER